MIHLIHPEHWTDYELIDCGNFEKLERFGRIILIRPEPQAIWPRVMSAEEWKNLAHARFIRSKKQNFDSQSDLPGGWTFYKKFQEEWTIRYQSNSLNLLFRLILTSFGHIGIFPEQASNWEFIFHAVQNSSVKPVKVLNLFAYTGGASLAARAAGADVVHLDSVKQVVDWARKNMELSGLDTIRWVVEDALLFARREVKRNKLYHGIILDPPAYGRGPRGEKWLLHSDLPELMELVSKLLHPKNSFLVMNLYSLGFSSLIGRNTIMRYFPQIAPEAGEFYIRSKTGMDLPLGTFIRFIR